MSQVTDWTIPGADDQPILGNTHMPAPGNDGGPDAAVGVLLICHGFKGYKDYGFFPHLAQAAASAGLIAHRFNFSHSGMTNDTERFQRPDLFEKDTWGRQVQDLLAVCRAVCGGELAGAGKPVAWFGHSRGGVTLLLTGGRVFLDDALKDLRPCAVVSASAPHQSCNFDADQRAMIKKVGRLASPSSRTGQVLYIGAEWVREIEADPDAFDPTQTIAQIACPILIQHGQDDSTVPVQAARKLADAVTSRVELNLIPGASHTFNAPNPLPLDQTPPVETQQMIDAACGFAARCCKEKK